MKERPILMSAPMVCAILDGQKTQTRRVVKPVGDDDGFVLLDHGNGYWPYRSDDGESSFHTVKRCGKEYLDETPHSCPYGQTGDRLWVREAWQAFFSDEVPADRPRGPQHTLGIPAFPGRKSYVFYRADGDLLHPVDGLPARWQPSIHLPRKYSRILLEVVSVRVERLADISDADSLAEGCYPTSTGLYPGAAKAAYRILWESLNGAGSWAANPWVWVVEFKRVKS